jgi:hypothetical protein
MWAFPEFASDDRLREVSIAAADAGGKGVRA